MTAPAILVGVDGSPPSLEAFDLAVAAARLRRRPVRAVYADPWAGHAAWANQDPDPQSEPQLAIRAVTERAVDAGVPVTAEIIAGEPSKVLISAAESSDLLFLGHRGRGGFPQLLLGSVASKVAAHAACTVVVTRGQAAPAHTTIVVGVDGTPANQDAVEFAFAEAELRGVPLRAVQAGPGPTGPSDLLLEGGDAGEEALDKALEPARHRHPGVAVVPVLIEGRPAYELIDASHTAALVVLGAHTPGFLPGTRLGTVSATVLQHAACPVAIARSMP
ncbi:universal stress protein [Hamadaea tsunoensis]|uniref:universal stress protein n=1 Tax=Hamadaea tsunoensis TaxID=53368 RepID=UPI0003FE4F60|nr:universal stress protein [Hamadaea tsunoensis]